MTAVIPIPIVLIEPEIRTMRWMERPRHFRRVFGAAQRAAICDERGSCDDWIMHWLKRCRQEALSAGYTRTEVDEWTMDGCLFGRREAHEPLEPDDD